MGNVQNKCAMIGCKDPTYRVLSIAPATTVELCAKHYSEEKRGSDGTPRPLLLRLITAPADKLAFKISRH